jgi:hypothetical protein
VLDIGGGFSEFASENDAADAPLDAAPDAVSIGALLSNATPIHWDEGVAVVEELLDLLSSSGRELPVPGVDEIQIHADGRVSILHAGRGDRGPAAAARTLHALLSGNDVPVALRLFVSQATAPETYGSLHEFAKGLAYYGKPGRTDLIQAVYRRYAATHDPRKDTPAKPAARPVDPKPAPTLDDVRRASAKAPRVRLPRWVVPAVLTVIVLGSGVWAISKIGFNVASLTSSGGTQPGSAPVAEKPAPAQASPSRPAPPASSDRRIANASKDTTGVAVAPRQSFPTVRDVLEAIPSPAAPVVVADDASTPSAAIPPPAFAPPLVAADPERIYSGDDPDVRPPVMRYPQLPAPLVISPQQSDKVNRMEILVATDGSVERVRLVGVPARMPDMMLLSGAKLWRFAPALKDGEPVRYRTFVTWSAFP